MDGKNLGILITAALNKEKSINQIRADLKAMEDSFNISVSLDAKNMAKKVEKDLSGVKKTMQDSMTLDMRDIEKNNSSLMASIKNLEKEFSGSTQNVVKNTHLVDDEFGNLEEKIKSYVVTMRTASDEIKKITFQPEEDLETGEAIVTPRHIQTIDDSARALRERDAVLKEEYQTRKRLEEVFNKQEEQWRKMGVEVIGHSDNLKNLNKESRDHLKTALQQSDAYGDLQIMEHNVNETTGKWTAALRLNGKEQLNLSGQIDRNTGRIHKQNEAVKEMAISNQGVMEQFKVAMARVPVWMAGMTLFYAPLRGLRSAIDDIIMLDTQMTTLRRVMDATPQTYNRLMKESIDLSIELGNRVEDVATAMSDFARQGFSPDEIMGLTETATVLSNISELDPSQAMDTITAGLNAFNMETDRSMDLIDKINEINFGLSA